MCSLSVNTAATALAQLADLAAADEVPVDLVAEAGLLGRVHEPVGVDLNIVHEAVLLGRVGQQDLEELTVLERP